MTVPVSEEEIEIYKILMKAIRELSKLEEGKDYANELISSALVIWWDMTDEQQDKLLEDGEKNVEQETN